MYDLSLSSRPYARMSLHFSSSIVKQDRCKQVTFPEKDRCVIDQLSCSYYSMCIHYAVTGKVKEVVNYISGAKHSKEIWYVLSKSFTNTTSTAGHVAFLPVVCICICVCCVCDHVRVLLHPVHKIKFNHDMCMFICKVDYNSWYKS